MALFTTKPLHDTHGHVQGLGNCSDFMLLAMKKVTKNANEMDANVN